MPKLLRMKKGDIMNINVDELVDFFVDSQNCLKQKWARLRKCLC